MRCEHVFVRTAMYSVQQSKTLSAGYSGDVSDGLLLHRSGSQKSQAPSISASACSASANSTASPDDVTPEVLMAWVGDVLSPDLVREVNAVYKFVITEDRKSTVYYLDLRNGSGSVGWYGTYAIYISYSG